MLKSNTQISLTYHFENAVLTPDNLFCFDVVPPSSDTLPTDPNLSTVPTAAPNMTFLFVVVIVIVVMFPLCDSVSRPPTLGRPVETSPIPPTESLPMVFFTLQ